MTTYTNSELEALSREVIMRVAQWQGGPEEMSDAMTLEQAGVDSLKFILIILEVEQAIGRKVFDVDNVSAVVTVGDVLKVIMSGEAENSTVAKVGGGCK